MMKILDIYKNPLYTLYQWDVNQFVNIVGINPDMPVSVQFWRAGQTEAFVVESTVSGNTVTAAIPNELLREPGELVIYIWQETGTGEQKGGRTETFFNVPIKERAQPSDYIYDDDAEYISVKTVIEDAKTATTAAQEATEAATAAAKLATDTAADIKQRADSGEFDGKDGAQGEPGQPGADGKSATITIGEVKTVEPDNPAIVTNTGNETDAIFNFEIPRGKDGQNAEIDLKTLEKVAIKTFIDGNPAMSSSSAEWRVSLIEGYGESTQFTTEGKNLIEKKEIFSESNLIKTFSPQGFWIYPLSIEDGQYTFWAEKSPLVISGYLAIGEYDDTKVTAKGWLAHPSVGQKEVITSLQGKKCIILKANSSDLTAVSDNIGFIQLEKGTTATSYEPYTGGAPSPSPEYPQEIKSSVVTAVKVTGKNLFDVSKVIPRDAISVQDNTIFVRKDNPYGASAGKPNLFKDYFPNAKIGQKYTLSFEYKNRNFITVFGYGTMLTNNTYTVTEEMLKGTVYFFSETSEDNFYKNIQFEPGVTATEYEPYKEHFIELSAPVTLRGILSESGNVTIDGQKYLSDYIGQKDGVYGVFRSFFVYEVTGNEDFASGGDIYQQDGSFDGYFNIVWEYPEAKDDLSATIKWGFCNFLSFNASVWSKAGEIGFCFNKNQIHIRVKNETISAAQEMEISQKTQLLKDYLKNLYDSGTPMIFLYPLATETFEPLPTEDAQALADLKTFYPSSIISWETEDNSGAWTRVEIIHDPTNYIDEKLEQITSQQTALQAEILKIGDSI